MVIDCQLNAARNGVRRGAQEKAAMPTETANGRTVSDVDSYMALRRKLPAVIIRRGKKGIEDRLRTTAVSHFLDER